MDKIVVAVDSFKGSLSAFEVSKAIEEAFNSVCPNCDIIKIPLSDGGEGLTDILTNKFKCGEIKLDTVDPLLRPIKSRIGVYKDTAIMDIASSAGLTLLDLEERNPMNTTTYGVGLMIKTIIRKGFNKFLIGVGGSATNDAGLGMLQAMGAEFFDKQGNLITQKIRGNMLTDIYDLNFSYIDSLMKDIKINVACDVINPFCGLQGAAYIYAKQKGANNEEIEILDKGLNNIRNLYKDKFGIDINQISGAGAAGGLGGTMSIALKAKLTHGVDYVLDLMKFDEEIKDANLVISGEGAVDEQSFMGKTISGVLKRTIKNNVPLLVIGGKIEKSIVNRQGIADTIEISPRSEPLEKTMNPSITFNNIYNCMKNWLILNMDKY